MENPTCAAFEEYEDVPKTVPLDFTEDDVTWVASKFSGAAGALEAEEMELRNWLLCFGCASGEFKVVVASLADLLVNPPPPPWDAYRALMAYRLVALYKSLGVHPVGIGETLRRALAKLVTREAGDQAKTACGNLQLCAGLKAGIEGATHAVGKRRLERVRARRVETEDEAATEDEEEEEGRGDVLAGIINLRTKTVGTEEEAAEGLAKVMEM